MADAFWLRLKVQAAGNFERACNDNHLAIAKWLAVSYGLTKADINIYDMMSAANRNNDLALIQWTADTFKLNKDEIKVELLMVCDHTNPLPIIKWVVETYKFTTEDIIDSDTTLLAHACKKGHLQVAKYVADVFALTSDHVRSFDNQALFWACDYGHLDVAKWLVHTFGLTSTDVKGCDAFRAACWGGATDIVKYLVTTFDFADVDISEEILHLCECGYLLMLQCVHRQFNIEYADYLLRAVLENEDENQETAQWLCVTYNLKTPNIRRWSRHAQCVWYWQPHVLLAASHLPAYVLTDMLHRM